MNVSTVDKPRRKLPLAHVAVILGMLASGGIVWQASQAAFSKSTSANSNTFSAGSVTITNERTGAVVFASTSNMVPGATQTKCVAVTYQGSVDAEVRMYASTYDDTGQLAQYLNLTIEEGDGGEYADDCRSSNPSNPFTASATGLSNVSAQSAFTGLNAKVDYAHAMFGSWTPTGGGNETKTYRISYTIPSNVSDNAQGKSLILGFTWEARSTG